MAESKKPEPLWPLPPPELTLAGHEIHIWCATLDQPAARVEQLAQLLAADESERAQRFVFEEHRQHYITGRALLRLILGRYLRLDPQRLRFKYGPQGKPALAEIEAHSSLKFNLSHSHKLVLYAVTYDQEIGVDLEAIRRFDDMEAIARRFFSNAEYSALSSLPPAEKPAGFFNCWTRKEAYIKALGDGLIHPLDQFDVSLVPGEPARLLRVQDDPAATARWSLYHLTPAPGYVGAVAIASPKRQLACWRWPDDS
jgi:4'-phosphopantetheinyl transferase